MIEPVILKLAHQTKFPTIWCQIFAEAVQRVENRLGVPLDASVGGKDHCIFVFPKSLVSKESVTNLNFAGFDYWHAWEQPSHAFDMCIVIGVKNSWFNTYLLPKLKKNPELVKIIEDIMKKICPEFYIDRMIRFNKMANTFSAWIKDYDTFGDYIDDIRADEIYNPCMTPAECLRKLNGLGVTEGDAIDKLKRYRYSDYNVLEYVKIVANSSIECGLFLKRDPATLTEFERQLLILIILMILLDLIFNEDPDTVEIITKLIEPLLDEIFQTH